MRRTAVLGIAIVIVALSGCDRGRETRESATPNIANKVAMRPVRLYFETPRMLLGAEARSVALPENAAAAVPLVLRELLKGPGTAESMRLFPQDTVLRGAYLLPGGTVVVDLGGATLSAGWSTGTHQELMAAHSVVHTLAGNFPDVKTVRLVVNGSPAETLAGHLSLGRSLAPLPDLIDPARR